MSDGGLGGLRSANYRYCCIYLATRALLAYIQNGWYVSPVPRPSKSHPERGDARLRLLDAARDLFRAKGYAATTVDDLCAEAQVTKGAFFHHFKTKEALGVAAAEYWIEWTTAFFKNAPYHSHSDPLARVLAYVDFRVEIIEGETRNFSCLVGTLVQEIYETHPAIRDACGLSIYGHAATLEADIAAAMAARGMASTDFTAASLARHVQTVIQGAFVLAKAGGGAEVAREALVHLQRYVELLFGLSASQKDKPKQEAKYVDKDL